MNKRGFTLIEIMVAMLILSGLSLIMAQSIKTGLQDRKKVQAQLSEESLVRDAMRLLVSDIGAAFHHRDYTVATYNKVLELRKKKAAAAQAPGGVATPEAGTVSGGGAAPTNVPPDPLATATPLPVPTQLTGFVGSNEAMTFTTRNHVRRFIQSKESDQARVSYYLKSCRGSDPKATASRCLVRLETTNPTNEFPLSPGDEDEIKGVVLVHNVTEFKLRYIVLGQQEFTDAWDSLPTSSSGISKERFPDAVEISLALHDRSNPLAKERKLSWLAPVRAPNNPDESDKDPAAATAGGTVAPAVKK